MRICVVSQYFYPEPIGIGKYTGEMVAFLADAGHDVRVVSAIPNYPQWKVQAPYKWWKYRKEHWSGADIYRSPIWVPAAISGFSRILYVISFGLFSAPVINFTGLLWKPDVFITVAPNLLNAPVTLLSARISRAKTWLHVQDFELDAAVNLGLLPFSSMTARLMSKFERWVLKRFGRVSTISHHMIDRLIEKGVEPQNASLFPNWADTREIFPLSATDTNVIQLKRDMDIPDGKFIVLYAGNMGYKQGIEVMIDAAHLLEDRDDIFFVLCGEGAKRQELEHYSRLQTNIIFRSLQPAERLNALLNAADIHILPQRADVADLLMPSKLSGMLASGKAVIGMASRGTELAAVLLESGVLLPPEDSISLAEAVRELADSPERCSSLGRKGRLWVENHWSSEIVLNAFRAELESWSSLI